jgi:transposase-like protein
MRKEGFGSVGQQKYMCPKCRHHLAKGNTKYGVIPAELKSKIRLYLKFDGISVRDIAGHFKVGVTTVRHIKEEYQKG